jgi:ribosome-binding ATPase YchF (GTP1/OBG family)
MPLQIGIVGLPNAGKSTLFNALVKGHAAVGAYPFTTIEPNVGIVAVPDPRLEQLTDLVKPEKVTPATVEFVDIAGLVKGAHKGEGLGNQFLAKIREVDAVCFVVRSFTDPKVTHVHGKVDPKEDLEVLKLELGLSDEQMKEKHADNPDLARMMLLSKPQIVVANVDEQQIANSKSRIADLGLPDHTIPISAKVEAELGNLSDEERTSYLKELGLSEPGLNRLIREAFQVLDLIVFYTAGPKEVRAWPVKNGAKAPEAAGEIHTDFEKGFIRAEVIDFDDYISLGGETKSKQAGKMRVEGKDYQVKDGDIIYFRVSA